MADSSDVRPQPGGHFSLPQLARAAVYHARGLRADATFEVVATGEPLRLRTGVAAGAWWAMKQAQHPVVGNNPGFATWAARQVASVGVDHSAAMAVLTEPLQAVVEAPWAGTALPVGAPLLQLTGPLPQLFLRAQFLESALALGFGSATRAAALCASANGRPIIDAATTRRPDPDSSSFLAWCGRVGGFAGTTHTGAGWEWEIPVVGIPSDHTPLTELGDALVCAEDLHASVSALVRSLTASSVVLKRVALDRSVLDEADLERHRQLRRALDRHGLRKVRICARVQATPAAVAQATHTDSPIDIIVISEPWWGKTPTRWVGSSVPDGIERPDPPAVCRGRGRKQLRRDGDRVFVGPWESDGLLRPLFAPGLPLSSRPGMLSRKSPLRASVHPELLDEAAAPPQTSA